MDKIASIPGATKIQLVGDGKVYTVVRPDELYSMTSQGWTACGEYREHAVITHKPQGRDPTPVERAAGAYGLVYDPPVHSFGEKQMFVVCRDATQLAEEKAHAEQIAELRYDLASEQRRIGDQGKTITDLTKQLEELRAKYDREKELHADTTTRKRALETDIGKIREAIGAVQFKNILGR